MKSACFAILLVLLVSFFQTAFCLPVKNKINEPDAEVATNYIASIDPPEVIPDDEAPISIPSPADKDDPSVLNENEIKVEARHHHHHHGIPHLGWIIVGVIFGIIALAWWGMGALCNACGCKETAQGCWSCGEGCLQFLALCGTICSCCQSCDGDPCCTDTFC